MKLQQLLDGTFFSEFILIHDNKEDKGSLILKEFIARNQKLQNVTHFICLERNHTIVRNCMPNNFLYVYYISDPACWSQSTLAEMPKQPSDPADIIQEIVKNQPLCSKTVIIIDSLALYFTIRPESCYQTIHSLVNNKLSSGKYPHQLVCLLHTDILPEGKKNLTMFEQLATTNLIISHDNNKSLVTLRHRKSSGRVIEMVEEFYFDKGKGLVTKEFNKVEEKPAEKSETNWINNNVTFKLELEDNEKKARSELVLPYLKKGNQIKEGQIIYEPDANDDWDEEDPDDDLNI